MGDTAIEWTDKTWNPTVGCTKISAGCARCYAKTLHDQRHKAHAAGKSMPAQYAHPFETLQLMPDRLRDPLSWRKPVRVFVNSVSDLFHEDVPDEFLDRVFAVMAMAKQHTFQVLTKRPERMRAYVERLSEMQDHGIGHWSGSAFAKALMAESRAAGHPVWPNAKLAVMDNWPLSNVWLGTSVENQAAADIRIPQLLATPAAVRFLSCEPLLGPVDLAVYALDGDGPSDGTLRWMGADAGIDWVIVGGESGKGARPFDLSWARHLREQCAAAGVAYFFKQAGDNVAAYDGLTNVRFRKKGSNLADIPSDLRVREFPL